jgi:hypothetical protein
MVGRLNGFWWVLPLFALANHAGLAELLTGRSLTIYVSVKKIGIFDEHMMFSYVVLDWKQFHEKCHQ